MGFLLDTNILIYRLKNAGNVNNNFLKNVDEPMSISVISYGELIFGAQKSARREQNLLTAYKIKEIFPVLNITPNVMDVFGKIKAAAVKYGRIIDDMDLLIAATALAHNLTLVTHNTKHFENIMELKLEDWYL